MFTSPGKKKNFFNSKKVHLHLNGFRKQKQMKKNYKKNKTPLKENLGQNIAKLVVKENLKGVIIATFVMFV
jgi:hypothetical protein